MARTALTAQQPSRTGMAVSFAAVNGADGNKVSNNGRRQLRFKNTGSADQATVLFGGTIDGVALTQGKAITLPATTGDITTGLWPVDEYNQADGMLYINFTSGSGVTVAVVDVTA